MAASFDVSGVRNLAADLGKLSAEALPNVVKALQVTANNVKKDWRTEAQRKNRRRARAYPYSITYDVKVTGKGVTAEIGPDLSKNQGQLGFLEESPGGVKSAPQGNARRALAANIDDFEQGILKAAGSVNQA